MLPAEIRELIRRALSEGQNATALTGPHPRRCASALAIPLEGTRDRVLGVLTLALGASGRSYGAADLTLAEDLASRGGLRPRKRPPLPRHPGTGPP